MIAPWQNWCRLCASTNGDVPIIHSGARDHFLSEKIKRYMAISILEEENVSYLLCNKCFDRLVTFDEFVHNSLQVQEMFSALTELLGENVPEDRLNEIRKEFLPNDYEVCNGLITNGHAFPNSNNKKKLSHDDKEHTRMKSKEENGSCKDLITLVSKKKEISSEVPSESNFAGCSKNGRSRSVVELKQAFGGENELLDDTLDSDFNEESFENLLDAEDEFQHDLKNSTNTFRLKDMSKPSLSSFSNQDVKPDTIGSPRRIKSEKSYFKDKGVANDIVPKRSDVSKLKDALCSSDLNCPGLVNDGNGTNAISLSVTDLQGFICNDSCNDGASENINSGDSGGKEMKVHGPWRSQYRNKSEELIKSANVHQEKLYELNDMFVEAENEGNCASGNGWTVEKVEGKDQGKKKRSKLKDQIPFNCHHCDKSFYRKTLLNSHLISHMPKDQQPYVCCKCARRFHCEALLRNHERSHLPNEEKRVFPCDGCDKKFSTRSAVTAHMKAIHLGERPFVCHLCGHSFSSKGILQEHLTIHSDEEPWHCSKCSKRFKTKYRLKIHMDTHRDTPYSCPHCPTQLSTRRTLRMHLVVHKDTKAYQCDVCGKAFRRAKDLKNHHNLHTGKRPYTCPFCSRTFANGSNCRSHKRRMHPEELRLYEAALTGNSNTDPVNNTNPLETEVGSSTLMDSQDLQDEDGNQSLKEDSQDSLLTEMALDLQQPQIISDKSGLTAVDEDPVVTAADLTLAPLVTLSSTLPKLEPDDSRLVMNLTTQMHDTHDSMEAMSPLNLNIMSPMNLNISSPLNLNISSPLNLNISSVLHSPTARNQQQHSIASQYHQNTGRHQQPHSQQQTQHLALQSAQHQTHQQLPHHHQLSHQPQIHQQMHQQQVPRSSLQITSLQTSLSSHSSIHTLTSQAQLPAHLNNTVHHTPQIQTFVPLNQQGAIYSHQTPQDSSSSAALVAAAAVAHSMTSSGNTTLPPFSATGTPYMQHSMVYGRSTNM